MLNSLNQYILILCLLFIVNYSNQSELKLKLSNVTTVDLQVAGVQLDHVYQVDGKEGVLLLVKSEKGVQLVRDGNFSVFWGDVCSNGEWVGMTVMKRSVYTVCRQNEEIVIFRVNWNDTLTSAPKDKVSIKGNFNEQSVLAQRFEGDNIEYYYLVAKKNIQKKESTTPQWVVYRVSGGNNFTSQHIQTTYILDSEKLAKIHFYAIDSFQNSYLYLLGTDPEDKKNVTICRISTPAIEIKKHYSIRLPNNVEQIRGFSADRINKDIVYFITMLPEKKQNGLKLSSFDFSKGSINTINITSGDATEAGFEVFGRTEDYKSSMVFSFGKNLYLSNATVFSQYKEYESVVANFTIAFLRSVGDTVFIFGTTEKSVSFASASALPPVIHPTHSKIPAWAVILIAGVCIAIEYGTFLAIASSKIIYDKYKKKNRPDSNVGDAYDDLNDDVEEDDN